jgi:hypothetical protein
MLAALAKRANQRGVAISQMEKGTPKATAFVKTLRSYAIRIDARDESMNASIMLTFDSARGGVLKSNIGCSDDIRTTDV